MNLIKLTLATLIFVMSFAMQSNEVEAQSCPPGYTYHSVQLAYPGTSCIYEVSFCYKCNHFGVGDANIKNVKAEVIAPHSSCPTDDIEAWSHNIALDEYVDLCNYPPCDEDMLTITVEMPLCIKKRNIVFSNGNITVIEDCIENDYVCLATYEVCFDELLQQYVFTPASIISYGTPCSYTIPVIPPAGMTFDDVWETTCWIGRDCPPEWWLQE